MTVTVTSPRSVDIVGVTEQFEPAFDSAAIVDDDGATRATVTTSADRLSASWSDRIRATLVYEVTVPGDAQEGETFAISGTVKDTTAGTETAVDGATSIEVGTSDSVTQYANDDGVVDSQGLLEAAAEFRDGAI